LELVDLYYVFKGQRQFILNTLFNLVPFYNGPGSQLVAEYLLHYFWALPGPDSVKIRQEDIQDLNKAIEVLTWIGEFGVLGMRRVSPIRVALRSLHSLYETASLYHIRRLQYKIAKSIQSIKKAAIESELSDKEKKSLIAYADSYLNKINSEAS